MPPLLWVCAGGALGSGARYLVSGWALKVLGPGFAYGTFIVNIGGSFLLAMILQATLASSAISPNLRIAMTTGVMGGFTTYSTFSYETMVYFRDGAYWLATLNIVLTVVCCLGASFLGYMAGTLITGR